MCPIGNFLSVHLADNISILQSRFGRRRVWLDRINQSALAIRQVERLRQISRDSGMKTDAKITASDFAKFNDAFHYTAREIRRHRETDTLKTAAAAENQRVNSDQTTFSIH